MNEDRKQRMMNLPPLSRSQWMMALISGRLIELVPGAAEDDLIKAVLAAMFDEPGAWEALVDRMNP